MKKQIVKIDAAKWFSSRNLRLCTPAARGFLLDLKCLSPGGYLVANGTPLSEDQIASLTGSTVGKVRDWLKELAAADAYEVDANGLYFPDMVAKRSKVADMGAKIGAKRTVHKPQRFVVPAPTKPKPEPKPAEPVNGAGVPIHPEVPHVAVKVDVKKSKAADWWLTPNGWWKKGQEQGVSMIADEPLAEFQFRVAKRLGEGEWLDVLPARIAKAIRLDIEQHAKKADE